MKKKNGDIVLLMVLFVVIAMFGIYAYSNYANAKTNEELATVAEWHFKASGETQEFGPIDLSDFVNATPSVASNKIAPGTNGNFNILLDVSASKTAVDYDIKMEMLSKPTNLHFYTDSQCLQQIPEKEGKLNVSGLIQEDDIKTPLSKIIYWKWAYETGETEEEIMENDMIDTKDQGIKAIFKLYITGTQKN